MLVIFIEEKYICTVLILLKIFLLLFRMKAIGWSCVAVRPYIKGQLQKMVGSIIPRKSVFLDSGPAVSPETPP